MVKMLALTLSALFIYFSLTLKQYISAGKLPYAFLGLGLLSGVGAVLFDSALWPPTIAFGLMALFEAHRECESIEEGTEIDIKDPTYPLMPVVLTFYLTAGAHWWSLSNPWFVFSLSFLVVYCLFLLVGAIVILKQKLPN